MTDQLTVQNSITINAPPAVVWDALVNPEQTKKYMFGCETVSDWQVGSPLLWCGTHEGHEVVFVEGHIVAIEPTRFLAYTTLDPNSGVDNSPENYLTVTYSLSAENDLTNLTVTQGDYATVADGQRRYQETVDAGGWDSVLVSIKALLEG